MRFEIARRNDAASVRVKLPMVLPRNSSKRGLAGLAALPGEIDAFEISGFDGLDTDVRDAAQSFRASCRARRAKYRWADSDRLAMTRGGGENVAGLGAGAAAEFDDQRGAAGGADDLVRRIRAAEPLRRASGRIRAAP